VPLTTLAVGTLRNEQIGNATGLQNLIRNIGGSIGLSFVSTLLVRFAQAHQSMLVGQLSPLNPQYQQKSAALQQVFEQRFNPRTPWRGRAISCITRCCNSPIIGRS
jgi:hypothetical protein